MTTWPSRMARTASATGSLWSPPSTSTLNRPVIVPAPVPGRGPFEQPRQLREHGRGMWVPTSPPRGSPGARLRVPRTASAARWRRKIPRPRRRSPCRSRPRPGHRPTSRGSAGDLDHEAAHADSASLRAFDARLRELWTRVAALEAPSGLQENSSWSSGLTCENFLHRDCAIVAKTTHANRFGCGNRALVLNFVFTRVVNHCVTVVGLQGPVARLDGGAESSESVTTES